uniref:cytochrome c oxidase subunit 3 n=1 Tax=Campylaephora sungminbooi TaxID=1896769 RepID=UPI002E7799C2|nr:cytochrome c oxidase subunit 3 [Campylaephora sungminbooi]WQF69647.1 cytochrome c oxidase subunit 3 [Campylaephora sungminbooi]
MTTTSILNTYQRHPFHLVDPSPWPFVASLAAFTSTIGGVLYFHAFKQGKFVLLLGFLSLLFVMFVWWRDVVRESTFEGHHTGVVQQGLRFGVILFIVSELFFTVACRHQLISAHPVTSERHPYTESMRCAVAKHGNSFIVWLHCNMMSPCNCGKSAQAITNKFISNNHSCYNLYNVTSVRVQCGRFSPFRRNLRIYVLSNHRVSWLSCYCWYNFFNELLSST